MMGAYTTAHLGLQRLIGLLCLGLLLGSGGLIWLRWKLWQRINTLIAGAEQLGQGQLGHRIVLPGRDEIGTLATTLNTMAANLQRQQEALASANAELETRVMAGNAAWAQQQQAKDTLAERYEQLRQELAMRQRIEHDLRQAKEAAEAATRLKSEFLATMSHEIRTPMNGVIGMTGFLLDTTLNTEQHEYVETIRRSGESLLAIINDILDFSKIEVGKLTLEVIDFDIRTMVEDVLDLVADRAYEKNLELALLVQAGVPSWVAGDPGRLRQILTNLVGNAVKFTDSGEIVVRISCPEAAEEIVALRFEIEDTGIGIAPEVQQRLFQPFTQADSSTTRKYGGTGLGLAISQRLVMLMGGEIGITSTLGQSSTFWFTVRLAKRPALAVSPPVTALHGVRVLCVDDNATNRTLLEGQLHAWGMVVDCVTDGPQALERLRAAQLQATPYAVAVLDYCMPGMDGMALAGLIKSDATIAEVRLVLLTSSGQRGDRKAAQQLGIAAYLTKPVRQSRLYDCLALVLGQDTAPAPQEVITQYRLAEVEAESRPRVLVVEDHIVNQRVAVRLLEKLGCRVDLATHGKEAVEMLQQFPYDLVFMDCQMPEMDGFTATRAIRQWQGNVQHTPIIAMTANAMQEDREACFAAGMDDYVAKPIDTATLRAVLSRWLDPQGFTAIPREDRAASVPTSA
jgi:signal transduction histidine kinase/DNA-binding response OmpR family regulator